RDARLLGLGAALSGPARPQALPDRPDGALRRGPRLPHAPPGAPLRRPGGLGPALRRLRRVRPRSLSRPALPPPVAAGGRSPLRDPPRPAPARRPEHGPALPRDLGRPRWWSARGLRSQGLRAPARWAQPRGPGAGERGPVREGGQADP